MEPHWAPKETKTKLSRPTGSAGTQRFKLGHLPPWTMELGSIDYSNRVTPGL